MTGISVIKQEDLYLLGMVDYLSKIHDLPMYTNYSDIRSKNSHSLYIH